MGTKRFLGRVGRYKHISVGKDFYLSDGIITCSNTRDVLIWVLLVNFYWQF